MSMFEQSRAPHDQVMSPTSGVVKVAGMDVTKEMDDISHVIGY
ncbi:hypothetical protein [Bacillus subtilis]|nr:hypothetical protein [Bacillus subtilis]